MQGISYEFKIDFALIMAVLSVIITISFWVLDKLSKNKKERIRAYEAVYDDACFVLEFPLHRRKKEAEKIEYIHSDPNIQLPVRKYLDSHWMDQTWGTRKFAPENLSTEGERRQFLKTIFDEAQKFQDQQFNYRLDLSVADRSPVFHFDSPELADRVGAIFKFVGKNLSLFSRPVQELWESAKFKDPQEVKREYERSLKVCPHFFQHNPRDFDDPFFDILVLIRQEYRKLISPPMIDFRWKISSKLWKLGRPFRWIRNKYWKIDLYMSKKKSERSLKQLMKGNPTG